MTAAGRFVRELTGRSHQVFVSLLRAQVSADLRAVELLGQALDGRHPRPVADELVDIEHDGDEQRSALVAELSRAITTPMDREDLFRVSSSIDDVLDNLRDFARELELYRPRSVVRFRPIIDVVSDALRALDRGIEQLSNGSQSVLAEAKAPRAREARCAGCIRRPWATFSKGTSCRWKCFASGSCFDGSTSSPCASVRPQMPCRTARSSGASDDRARRWPAWRLIAARELIAGDRGKETLSK